MRNSAIRVSESYVIPAKQRADLGLAAHQYGAAQNSPDALGGHFDFTDWQGRPLSYGDFVGRWTLLYFGYSRCQGSCRAAAPAIADAARRLRDRGLAATALFIDIEPPQLPTLAIIEAGQKDAIHRHDLSRRVAMGELAMRHGGGVTVASGNRGQISRAMEAYHILREHVPARGGGGGHAINHSSAIYLLDSDAMVAAYGYHDMSPATIVGLVDMLSKAPRREIDTEAIRARVMDSMCGVGAAT